ncbi:MAG: MBL fold metallo-hydrolase [Desulfobacula sp.]|nr:MBL fold metallo-hydrolase [Desulfobacula sp.]
MMFNNCSTLKNTVTPSLFEKIQHSPQYKDGKFAGEKKALTMTPVDWVKSSWRFLFEKNGRTPVQQLPIQSVDLSFFNSNRADQLNSTWIGHSSLLINISGYKILADPVFEKKVSVVGPTRFNGEAPLNPDELLRIDLVIISHDHYDHLNKASILQLLPKVNRFLTPLAVGKRLMDWGIPAKKIIQMDWWENFQFDNHLKITATPAQHFSGRGVFDRNKTLWASWVITTPEFNIFYSGDSGYFNGFKKIGERFGPFDMTFLECGAYDKLWHGVHMFPEETVQAHIDLKGNLLHPIHWGTFNLALHPWYDPMQRVEKAAKDNNITIATPIAGQTIEYGTQRTGFNWWDKNMALN